MTGWTSMAMSRRPRVSSASAYRTECVDRLSLTSVRVNGVRDGQRARWETQTPKAAPMTDSPMTAATTLPAARATTVIVTAITMASRARMRRLRRVPPRVEPSHEDRVVDAQQRFDLGQPALLGVAEHG